LSVEHGTLSTSKYYYDGSLLLAEKINGQVQKEYINDGQGITGIAFSRDSIPCPKDV